MKKNKITTLILLIVLVLAFLTRAYKIANHPPGFFCDEAARGVDAYSILKTGKDWHGVSYPIFFEALGEYTPPLMIYSMIPQIAILGLSETSVRLTAVIWGTLAVFFSYLLAKEMFSVKVGLLTAVFMAIEPWAFHYSRYGTEFITLMATFLLAFFLSLKALKDNRFLPTAAISWGLTLYSYPPARLQTPLFLLVFLIIDRQKLIKKRKLLLFGILILVLISTPLLANLASGKGLIRWSQVSIFQKELSLPESIKLLTKRYLIQFTPSFLFLKGDPTFINRHFTGGLTPLLFIQLPLIMIGLAFVFLEKKWLWLFLSWFLIYPLGGSLTHSGPLSSRSIIGAPLFALLSAYGLDRLLKYFSEVKRKKIWFLPLTITLAMVITANFFLFAQHYFQKYPVYSADFWGWQYGPKEIINYFLQVEDNYEEFIMSDRFNAPNIFLKFYAPNGCKNCKIGTLSSLNPTKKQLFALPPEDLMHLDFKLKKNIYYPNGKIAFQIVEFNNDE